MRSSRALVRADRRHGRARSTGAALACVVLVLTGCTGGDAPTSDGSATSGTQQTDTQQTDTEETTSPTGADDLTPTSAPGPADPTDPGTAKTGLVPPFDLGRLDGELREQTQWLLERLTEGATGPSEEEAAERFSTDFLEAVPADQIEPVLTQFRGGPALTLSAVGEVQERGDGAYGVELTLTGEQPLRLSLGVDADGLIDALLIQPGPPQNLPELGSWEELDEEFSALGGTTAVFVGEVSAGRCTTVHASEAAQEPTPSGSVFKLIVLTAVADAVANGELAWDDELTLTAPVKSLPSGELQDRPDGSTLSVREAATLMISISDNTATDLLMETIGPERLAAVMDSVVEEPERRAPLLTTQQFFLLGWDAPDVRAQWADADPAERTALLEQLPQDLSGLRANPFSVSDPAWQDGVGWFLTGAEICTLHAMLQQQAQGEAGEPLRQILSANPGLPRPDGARYQAFKGGSAPGVLAYTFYVETSQDGDPGVGSGRVLSVQVSHSGPILATAYTDLTQAGLELLTQE
ncbi:serine hydrolase [Ornithinimicrobium ciconiae]|uniref:Serine hydrolase n=1 Tax=Ornithinimicrobium ciconiae TaxID=2594265 RepID=A0A516G893_9MICO|nr:serine hydrolase [Ornithinimicrobium ciconiae]QDO87737.1 serine hydrolase [Ornithinimicrobium ciconiae]